MRKGCAMLQKCEDMVGKLGLFSSNETKEDISTNNLKYLLVWSSLVWLYVSPRGRVFGWSNENSFGRFGCTLELDLPVALCRDDKIVCVTFLEVTKDIFSAYGSSFSCFL